MLSGIFPFAAAIALSAFLLFQVQPIVGKWVLPGFGGTPAVWTTCMAFFQLALLAGYAYAHFSVRWLRPRMQVFVHSAFLGLGVAGIGVLISMGWRPASAVAWDSGGAGGSGGSSDPVRILTLLAATIGGPFVALSATAPLLQAWFNRRWPSRSPYRLYSLSNAASLLALVSYPFLIEPYLPLHAQAWVWWVGFAAFALICAAAGVRSLTHSGTHGGLRQPAALGEANGAAPPTVGDRLLWFCLSACASVLLLATTAHLSQDVAAAPFVWVLPLALYLLTFVFCFEREGWYRRGLWVYVLPPAVAAAALAVLLGTALSLPWQVIIHGSALFACCTVCHGELARLKPAPRRLTGFYLTLAAGGAAGGLAVALGAPRVFNGFREYPLGLGACCLLLLVALFRRRRVGGERRPAFGIAMVSAAAAVVAVTTWTQVESERRRALAQSRNFYGVLRVDQFTVGPEKWPARGLFHGRIQHGFQLLDPQRRRQPTCYYGPDSGIGIAQDLIHEKRAEAGGVRMGVVGLGAGVTASFGRAGDSLCFYEINPDVVKMEREYFTFLHDTPADVRLVEGDARLMLERERSAGRPGEFDLLILDAFSGDAPPLHLLTREAFAVYQYHLRPGGVLAVNVTNRHLNLAPLVRGLAGDAGRSAVVIESARSPDGLYDATVWALVTNDTAFLADGRLKGRAGMGAGERSIVFTDEQNSLWPLLRGARE